MTVYIVLSISGAITSAWQQREDAEIEIALRGGHIEEAFAWPSREDADEATGE